MNRPRPTYFRNSLDLRDKVQVKILRKRLNLSNDQFAEVFRKSGNSISAIAKEAATQVAKEAAVSMSAKAMA
jgi:DNA-binding transcriptional regulator YiaG